MDSLYELSEAELETLLVDIMEELEHRDRPIRLQMRLEDVNAI